MESTIAEYRNIEGIYGLHCQQMILDTDKHGRILLSESFGGVDSLDGGAYRWRHGFAVSLKPGDTFESLEKAEWNEGTRVMMAVVNGYDEDRPILEWSGMILTNVAKKALRHAGMID